MMEAKSGRPGIGWRLPQAERLTAGEEQALAARRVAGDVSARDALVLSGIGLACKCAVKFRRGYFSHHRADLKSIALLGLFDAAERYEPGKVSGGRVVRFGTYATYWIRHRLETSDREDLAMIQIPMSAARAASRHRKRAAMAATVGAAEMPRKIHGRPDLPCDRKTAAHVERARSIRPTGQHGRHNDGLDAIPADAMEPEGEPGGSPVLSRAMDRLRREAPDPHGVICLLFLSCRDGASVDSLVARTGRSAVWLTKMRDRGLSLLGGYLREAGVSPRIRWEEQAVVDWTDGEVSQFRGRRTG